MAGDDQADPEQPGEGGELLDRAGTLAVGGDHHRQDAAITRRVASRATVRVLPAPGGPTSSSGDSPSGKAGERDRLGQCGFELTPLQGARMQRGGNAVELERGKAVGVGGRQWRRAGHRVPGRR